MKIKKIILQGAIFCFILFTSFETTAHEIYFCGEKIPLTDEVAKKLMDIIKKQINYNVVSSLTQKGNLYIQTIEKYLEKTGLPDDFKYLAIVESGFKNVVSSAGAAGFWQLMPGTARELGLIVNELVDERKDLDKSTYAACRHLANNFNEIRKKYSVSSWVLTAAAYNFGSGNMGQAIKKYGKNYFEMDLNKETAEYVYKIIAVKELFEYPELYMKGFGYNIFNLRTTSKIKNKNEIAGTDDPGFEAISIKVNSNDGNHPKKIIANNSKNKNNSKTSKPIVNGNIKSEDFIFAHITGNYDNFKDSSEIIITLDKALRIENLFMNIGSTITGIGWKIDDKVFIDLGYGKKLVIIDFINKKHDGVAIETLKDKAPICLKSTIFKN